MTAAVPLQSIDDLSLLYQRAMEVDTTPAAAGATDSTNMDSKASVRSCTTCSKAKAKCVRQPGHEICERCARLRKECHSREPVLRRRKVVKTTRAAQLEKLENKIEHLVNALSTTQAQRGFSTDLGQPSPPVSQISERSASNSRQSEVLNSLCEGGPEYACQDTPLSTATTSPSTTITAPSLPAAPSQINSPPTSNLDSQSLGVSLSEAEILYDRYRRLMSYSMPFVDLSPYVTAKQLFAAKPLLLHAIVVVTYFHDFERQQLMVKQLMRDISERVLINSEKSLDILEGILVFMSWYHPHLFTGGQAGNLLHIAMSLANDLGIDRPPQACGDFKGPPKGPNGVHFSTRVPTLEEHRALLGTFYLSSMIASSFRRHEPMPYTSYMDEASNALEEAKELESDLFLIQIVRLQRLINDTCATEAPDAPMQMYVKAFHADLERIKKNDPCRDVTNIYLQMQYLASEIMVWELSLNDLQENKAKPLRSHLDDLYHCVQAIKSFIDIYFSIPSSAYLTIPFLAFGQFAHAFIMLVKLASLEVDGWDMKLLNEQLNFVQTIEEAATRFEDSAKSAPDGIPVNNDIFVKWASRVRWMKQVYEAKFVQETDKSQERPDAPTRMQLGRPAAEGYYNTPTQQQPTPPDDMLSGDFFNYLDENFWQNFAGDFDLGFPEMSMT